MIYCPTFSVALAYLLAMTARVYDAGVINDAFTLTRPPMQQARELAHSAGVVGDDIEVYHLALGDTVDGGSIFIIDGTHYAQHI